REPAMPDARSLSLESLRVGSVVIIPLTDDVCGRSIHADPPWEDADFVQITAPREVLPGFFLIETQSDKPGTREMNEISLLVRTEMGGVVVVGCSHPGIEKILDAVIKIEPCIFRTSRRSIRVATGCRSRGFCGWVWRIPSRMQRR